MSRFKCPICLYPLQTEAEREAHVLCSSDGTEWCPDPWDTEDRFVPLYGAPSIQELTEEEARALRPGFYDVSDGSPK